MSPAPLAAAAPPLVVRFGALGDSILLTSLVEALAERWGRPCDLVVGAGSAGRQVFAGLPSAGEIVALSSRRTPYWLSAEQRRLVAWLRRRGDGPAWAVESIGKVLWLLARGGVGDASLLTARGLPRGDLEHPVDYYARWAAAVPPAFPAAGAAAAPEPRRYLPRLHLSDHERDDVAAWIERRGWAGRPLVLLQTQSRKRHRGRWPVERWAAVAGAVLARLPGARLVVIGAPAEAADVAAVAAACGDPRVEPAAVDLPLRRLFALAAAAHSCISLDTGPAHAAAVLGCPLVVVCGRADPRRNHPVPCGSPVRVVVSHPPGEWPPTADGFVAWHRVERTGVAPVVAAWEEVAAIGRGGGGGLAYRAGGRGGDQGAGG